MSSTDLTPKQNVTSTIPNLEDLISRYKRMMQIGRDTSIKIAAGLSKNLMEEGGRKIGLLRNGSFDLLAENERPVLVDYCLYDLRRNGRNAIDQYLIDFPPDPESDEMTCLKAMQNAIYSMFVVVSTERGLGMTVRDLYSQEISLIVDLTLGYSNKPGLVFASRLLKFDGFSTACGAALPVSVMTADEIDNLSNGFAESTNPNETDEHFDPAPIIRACLKDKALPTVEYRDTASQTIRKNQNTADIGSPLGRNSICPCGSGKKFKKCCMNRS